MSDIETRPDPQTGTQYFCGTERRRRAVADHATINGIDYLEVLDAESPEESLRQRTLAVRLLKAVPGDLIADNVRLTGGVRIAPVNVEWVAAASAAGDLFADGLVTEDERDAYLAMEEPENLLLVRTDVRGDFSDYLLCLVASPTAEEPPPDFDVLLSRVRFGFKVECPSEFDCRTDPLCPEDVVTPPVIDYLAKDYASFRRLMLDRLAVLMPEWKDRNAADLGVTLVELLAYVGDRLSYHQDAAATEAYLDTARRRTSVRRHARLLDYPMHDGCNARVWVTFDVDGDGVLLESGGSDPIRLLTRVPATPLTVVPADFPNLVDRLRPTVFELCHDIALYRAHATIPFYTWGDEACCLPRGATRATLRDDTGNRLRLRSGDVLIFEEVVSPDTGLEEDADPAKRHAVRLTRVHPEAPIDADGLREVPDEVTDPLFEQPIVEIEWDPVDALPFALCLSAMIEPDGLLEENVSVARGNVALADHGRTLPPEPVDPPTGYLRYRPRLEETNVTQTSGYDPEQGLEVPAARTVVQDPAVCLAAVSLEGTDAVWTVRRDLLASDRFAAEFVVETETDGSARLRFGDGEFGRDPGDDAAFIATYRIGTGTSGNVGADAIAHIVTDVGGVTAVRNPLPAVGGTDPETLEEVRRYAPQAFRTQERAVTEADYAEVTERHPDVQRAVATRRWTGSWYTMFVTVDRKGGRTVDAAFETELRAHLEKYRLAGHDIEVDGPRFVPLDIVMSVCVEAGYFRSEVKRALLDVFSSREFPDGRRGFFHPDAFTFAEPVYMSQVVAAAMEVEGVRWVDITSGPPLAFKRYGQPQRTEIDDGLIEMNRLEIARLDNDPSRRENGKIEFLMEGGL